MADQDELVQMGSETMLEESLAQDDSFEGDLSLQPYPEVTLGATAPMLEDPLHQIPPTEDRAIPIGSTPDHSRSASPKPFDMNQLVEILTQMKGVIQTQMKADMQTMERNLLTSWKVGLAEVKELHKIKKEQTQLTQELKEVKDAEIKRGKRTAQSKRGAHTNGHGKGH